MMKALLGVTLALSLSIAAGIYNDRQHRARLTELERQVAELAAEDDTLQDTIVEMLDDIDDLKKARSIAPKPSAARKRPRTRAYINAFEAITGETYARPL